MNRILETSFAPIYGQPCWGVNYDRYSHLSMNFGEPWLKVYPEVSPRPESKRVKFGMTRCIVATGQWWLWFRHCFWTLTLGGGHKVVFSDSYRRIELAMNALDGQKLKGVEINPRNGATTFSFDLGARLACRRWEPDSELWVLYKPKGLYLSVYGDGTFSHDRGKDSEVEKRRPIG